MDRRTFVKSAAVAGAVVASGLAAIGCSAAPSDVSPDGREGGDDGTGARQSVVAPDATQGAPRDLPPANPDPESGFGVDSSINIETIDEWLERDDVAYRDVRMLFDPADYASIGGDPDLTATVEGFKVVPFPLVATLPPLPVAGAYEGPAAWTVEWAEDGSIASASPAYRESESLLRDLFPEDKAIFLMCGAGGYAGQMRQLLIHLGWDAEKVYNVGGFWSYAGKHRVELIGSSPDTDDGRLCCMWRVEVAPIDFTWMHSL